jgi:hypothetical protein
MAFQDKVSEERQPAKDARQKLYSTERVVDNPPLSARAIGKKKGREGLLSYLKTNGTPRSTPVDAVRKDRKRPLVEDHSDFSNGTDSNLDSGFNQEEPKSLQGLLGDDTRTPTKRLKTDLPSRPKRTETNFKSDNPDAAIDFGFDAIMGDGGGMEIPRRKETDRSSHLTLKGAKNVHRTKKTRCVSKPTGSHNVIVPSLSGSRTEGLASTAKGGDGEDISEEDVETPPSKETAKDPRKVRNASLKNVPQYDYISTRSNTAPLRFRAVEIIAMLPHLYRNQWIAQRLISNGITPALHVAILKAHRKYGEDDKEPFKRDSICAAYRDAMRDHDWRTHKDEQRSQ